MWVNESSGAFLLVAAGCDAIELPVVARRTRQAMRTIERALQGDPTAIGIVIFSLVTVVGLVLYGRYLKRGR